MGFLKFFLKVSRKSLREKKPSMQRKQSSQNVTSAIKLYPNKAVHTMIPLCPLLHYKSMSEYIYTFSHFVRIQ